MYDKKVNNVLEFQNICSSICTVQVGEAVLKLFFVEEKKDMERPSLDDYKKRVCYFYDDDVGKYMFGPNHVMKPIRIEMTHRLVHAYELYKHVTIMKPPRTTPDEMKVFHEEDYIDLLRKVKPEHMCSHSEILNNLGGVSLVFDGIYEYCQICTGGSVAGATCLNSGDYDIAINWAGGMHHARRFGAAGFCYVNDIVLAILELLKKHERVLYIDIDCHHGAGVEEAFYTTDRVMTVSFHKYGNYFPGTGNYDNIGYGEGKYYAVNFPLLDGISDLSYLVAFRGIISSVMKRFQPKAIVMQCGADSMGLDRLGCFNLTTEGHGELVKFVRSYSLPLLLLGGGGYTLSNVTRCWTYETAVAANVEISNSTLPFFEQYDIYGPTFTLHTPPVNTKDHNTPLYLENMAAQLLRNIHQIDIAPSVQISDMPGPSTSSDNAEANTT
ncbi:Histone deacetylase 1 [Trichinella pseudospiralis]|uniref:Histone deacetylase 1 n=2 Tax=Trichinella pseudospiralis TaxID=6337 RepID=A0A0V1FYZ7_TRIPS|nr:Histone deacetylase 1 [Trichinella pseudospiralis]KRZ27020.1 Histone deacetylase 1 [Trichinella pseudospiralis]